MVYLDSNGIPEFFTGEAAFETVRNHIASLDDQNTDLLFLKSLMESPQLNQLVRLQDQLEEKLAELRPVATGNSSLATEICQRYDRSYKRDAKELTGILRNKAFKALLEAHDSIASDYLDEPGKGKELRFDAKSSGSPWETIEEMKGGGRNSGIEVEGDNTVYSQPIRIISLRKSKGQPLGVTVEEDGNNLVVARIFSGGLIDRLGLLKVGDAILEVNSVEVKSPEQLQTEVGKAKDSLQLKVGSPLEESRSGSGRQVMRKPSHEHKTLCFMRALFTYDPAQDGLLPCKEVGLGFITGDILHIVDQSDPNWWQAKKVGESAVGLIPSRELEERRAAFVRPEADFVHSIGICGTRIARKKKKCAYAAKTNSEYDRAELTLYEEVTRMPPFRRKTLILVGTSGVGRRTLKTRLLNSDPNKFGAVIPYTSRPPREGEEQMGTYEFVSREYFEDMIRRNELMEFGEREGAFYGTTYTSVREVIREGKMCVLDVAPTALKILHNSPDFMPYVVFLAAPGADNINQQEEFARSHGYSSRTFGFDRMSSIRYSSRRARTLESIASLYEEEGMRETVEESQRLERLYSPYFDLVIVNEDFDTTFRRVAEALEALLTDHQWVPVSWLY